MDRLPVSINPCPIAEAIFEVRFETTYPGDAIFGIIYNQFKNEFPKVTKMPVLQLPAVVREQDPNLQFTPHYKMSGDNYLIQLGPNVFSLINTGPYRGWDAFSEKILESYNKISALKIIEKHQRTALRYINVFEGADIFNQSTLSIRLKNDDLKGVKTNMTIEMPYDYGVRVLRMVNFARAGIENKMVEGSIIDIDTQVAVEKCAGLEDAISKAHMAEKELFFGLLQKDFIETLNPVY